MKLIITLFFLGMLSLVVTAQEKSPASAFCFRSIYALHLINGTATTSFGLETVQGVSWKKSFAGAGIGIDYYRFRTIPVFLQLRQGFGKGKRNIFLYGNGGYSIDWLTQKTKEGGGDMVKYKGGWYYDTGLGYKIELKNDNALFLSAGYSVKQLKKNVYYRNCFSATQCADEVDIYQYSMSRVLVKAAFQF